MSLLQTPFPVCPRRLTETVRPTKDVIGRGVLAEPEMFCKSLT